MRKLEKRQLVERTRDLKQTVLALEREVCVCVWALVSRTCALFLFLCPSSVIGKAVQLHSLGQIDQYKT